MNETIFLEQSIDSKCKNLIDSYGYICVKCNCCGRMNPESNSESMYASRLRVARRHFKEWQPKLTDPDFQTALQQKNIRIGIRCFQRQIKYYEHKVLEVSK